jgi:hypothetical protein
MTRLVPLALGAVASLAVAACGSSSASTGAAPSSSASQRAGRDGGFRRNVAAGELVRISGTSLLLNTQTGDVTVDYSASTPITRTRTGTVAEITPGSCINATGQRDSSGMLTASTVVLNSMVNGTCTGPGGPGGFSGDRSPGASPGFRLRTPPPGAPAIAFARGAVTAVSGTSVTVSQPSGSTVTITVPTTVRVTVAEVGSSSDLVIGACVLANGPKNSAGAVQARSLTIFPAGASGCTSGPGGGRGFFGGGRGGGGGGFGGGGGAGSDGAGAGGDGA